MSTTFLVSGLERGREGERKGGSRRERKEGERGERGREGGREKGGQVGKGEEIERERRRVN